MGLKMKVYTNDTEACEGLKDLSKQLKNEVSKIIVGQDKL